ncbi:hypothetical protein EXIGLDRAFT_843307 [Exidia glandulosa HHB12029]|uniref:Uncharacterized protein n=1 Tax=Exidia glandulosa HHB12029 TaxID=1314781 RepID=A0A165CRL0_EXIGL|nr:hypothetical protein EXIGLDRAFT_843307 [Exidia glandulosa HHB12029]
MVCLVWLPNRASSSNRVARTNFDFAIRLGYAQSSRTRSDRCSTSRASSWRVAFFRAPDSASLTDPWLLPALLALFAPSIFRRLFMVCVVSLPNRASSSSRIARTKFDFAIRFGDLTSRFFPRTRLDVLNRPMTITRAACFVCTVKIPVSVHGLRRFALKSRIELQPRRVHSPRLHHSIGRRPKLQNPF